jgi:hypothetical protein
MKFTRYVVTFAIIFTVFAGWDIFMAIQVVTTR